MEFTIQIQREELIRHTKKLSKAKDQLKYILEQTDLPHKELLIKRSIFKIEYLKLEVEFSKITLEYTGSRIPRRS